MVDLNSCKMSTEGWLFTLGQMSNLSLAWKKADVFKINNDDVDDESRFSLKVDSFCFSVQAWENDSEYLKVVPMYTKIEPNYNNNFGVYRKSML